MRRSRVYAMVATHRSSVRVRVAAPNDAPVAQLVEAAGLDPVRWGFESLSEYQSIPMPRDRDRVSETQFCWFESNRGSQAALSWGLTGVVYPEAGFDS